MAVENVQSLAKAPDTLRIQPPHGTSLDNEVRKRGLPTVVAKPDTRFPKPIVTDIFRVMNVSGGDDQKDKPSDNGKGNEKREQPGNTPSDGIVPPDLPPPHDTTLSGGPEEPDEFSRIMAELGLHSDIAFNEEEDRRINTRATDETLHAIHEIEITTGESMSNALRKLLVLGIVTDNFHDAKIPVTVTDLNTGEKSPFPTETTLVNTTRDTQIPLLDEEHPYYGIMRVDVALTDEMLGAITAFKDRYECTDEQALNALTRRGVLTREVLRDPSKKLSYERPSKWFWKRKTMNFKYLDK